MIAAVSSKDAQGLTILTSELNVLLAWIAGLEDKVLLDAFDRSLVEDEIALMWHLADEIDRRKLSV